MSIGVIFSLVIMVAGELGKENERCMNKHLFFIYGKP